MLVSIVVPVYNEEENIAIFYINYFFSREFFFSAKNFLDFFIFYTDTSIYHSICCYYFSFYDNIKHVSYPSFSTSYHFRFERSI